MVKLFRHKTYTEPLKRGRGRPRKYPLEPISSEPSSVSSISSFDSAGIKNFLRVNRTIISFAVVFVLALIPSIYFYNQNKDTQKKLNETSQKKSDEPAQIIEKVAKHALLPTDEQPTIATISDPEKLKGQAFFTSAQTGDKVLVYSKAGKAVLYRPSIDKVIVMAPLNSESQNPQQ